MTQWQHGFYRRSIQQRQVEVAKQFALTDTQQQHLDAHSTVLGDQLVENYIGDFTLPEGLGLNLVVNDRSYSIPMVTEEPSVIAAASNGAKIVAQAGGFHASAGSRRLVGQIVLNQVTDVTQTTDWLRNHESALLWVANQAYPSMQARGAGAQSIRVRPLPDQYLSVDLLVDVSEAMGANVVNTMCEAVAQELRAANFHVLTAILSNLATESLQTVTCEIPVAQLAITTMTGIQVATQIAALSHLAQIDPYRATTHNKGIMNGIDAAVMASGNDWRNVESAAHAFAVVDGQYRGLSAWRLDAQILKGSLTLPLAIGTVGGSIGVVPMVQINQQISQVTGVQELAMVIASIGLAQNLAALKALATTGIQAGHMKLQYRSLALAVGATGDEVSELVTRLVALPQVDRHVARQQLDELRKEQTNGRN